MIPAERAHLRIAARSHPGMSGKNNEDRYSISAYRVSLDDPAPSVLAIVSDGIGGHRAGEVAAEVAVETISQFIAASEADNPQESLRQAIIDAGQAIYAQSEADDSQRGMGATCACAWIIGDRLYIATVGDSRIYLIRNKKIRQLSVDHTWIQEALEKGALTPDEARNHPNAHVIRRYLGSRQPAQPDLRIRLQVNETDYQSKANQGLTLLPGDQLILCSDGLTDLVSDVEILQTLTEQASLETALEQLIDLANNRGGHDNITIVSLGVPAATTEVAPVAQAPARPVFSTPCLVLSALALLIVIAVGGALWSFFDRGQALIVPTPTSTAISFPTFTPTLAASEPVAPTRTSPGGSSPTAAPGGENTPGLPAGGPTITPWPTNTLAP